MCCEVRFKGRVTNALSANSTHVQFSPHLVPDHPLAALRHKALIMGINHVSLAAEDNKQGYR